MHAIAQPRNAIRNASMGCAWCERLSSPKSSSSGGRGPGYNIWGVSEQHNFASQSACPVEDVAPKVKSIKDLMVWMMMQAVIQGCTLSENRKVTFKVH